MEKRKKFSKDLLLDNPNCRVETRNGTPVEIIAINGRGDFPVAGYLGYAETVLCWTNDGNFFKGKESEQDLFIVIEEPDIILTPFEQAVYNACWGVDGKGKKSCKDNESKEEYARTQAGVILNVARKFFPERFSQEAHPLEWKRVEPGLDFSQCNSYPSKLLVKEPSLIMTKRGYIFSASREEIIDSGDFYVKISDLKKVIE